MNMKKSRSIALHFLAVLVVLTLAAADLYLAFESNFGPQPPPPDFPKPANALEAQRQDLAYFRVLLAMDRSFTPAARTEAQRRIAALERTNSVLHKAKIRVALMEIVALADNGHTRMSSDPGAYPKELPVRVTMFSDGLYVMHASEPNADLLGGRIVSVDGRPIDEVMRRLQELRGGVDAWRKYYATVYLAIQDILHGAGIAPDMQHSTWTVMTPGGASITRTLEAYVPDDQEPFPLSERWLSNEPVKGMPEGWRAYGPKKVLPLALQDFDTAFRHAQLPNSCSMFIQFKSNQDTDEKDIGDFIDESETDMEAKPPCNVILDMRFNGGGDYTNTASFANGLPDLLAPGGRIYLLTGPATFSAGITTTAFIKQAGGDRVTILGEEVGDRLAFYAEGVRACLPHFHLCMIYQRGKHDYAHPCMDWDECFWLNWLYPVRVKTLEPDETITLSFAQWREGRDPVFERALALATAQGAKQIRE